MSDMRGDSRRDKENDNIAVLICQDRKQGELDEKLEIASQNSLRFSFRSAEGTSHAALLASLFNGGGHGAAAGGHLSFPGVELDSKLAVNIQGQRETDPKKIYQTLRQNEAVLRDSKILDAQKSRHLIPIQVVMDPTGKTCADLIQDIVQEIRAEQTRTSTTKDAKKVTPKALKAGRRPLKPRGKIA
jgi:hypothetical protein